MSGAKRVIGGGLQIGVGREEQRPTQRHVARVVTEKAKDGHVVREEFAQARALPHEMPRSTTFKTGESVQLVEHYLKAAGITGVKVVPVEPEKA